MKQSIIIADTAYKIAKKFSDHIKNQSELLSFEITSTQSQNKSEKNKQNTLVWDRKSSLSSVAVIRRIEVAADQIPVAVIFLAPEDTPVSEKSSATSIEKFFDQKLKAYFFLFRSLTEIFSKQGFGLIIPVLYKKQGSLSFYDKIAAAAFLELTDQLIRKKDNPYQTVGIDSGNITDEQLLNIITAQIQNPPKHSKWVKPDTKSNIKSFFNGKRV